MESIVKTEDGRIIGLSKDAEFLEYIDGQWTKPTTHIYGSDFYDGTPIKEEEL